MKPSISVLKVKNKVKKTVKRADDRIKSFNKFITGNAKELSKIKLPEPITFFKAKAFIKSLDRLQGAKGAGPLGMGGGAMNNMLTIAAGSAILTMGALAFAPNPKAGESQSATDQVLKDQYGGDKRAMKKDLNYEKKKAQEGSKDYKNLADQRKTDVEKTVDKLAKSKTEVMGSGMLAKGMSKEGPDITKKEKLDVNKFKKLSEQVEDLVASGILKRAMGPSFWEWSGDRAREMWEGTKRVAGGTLDLLTFNIFDFDKKDEPERTVDEDGFPRADGALDEERFAKIKLNYVKEELLTEEKPQTKFKPKTEFVPQKETLIASTNLSGMGIEHTKESTGSTFGSTDGGTGRVSNAAGWVHGHFQTNTGTVDDLISDVTPIIEKLIAQDIPTELSGGQKFKKGMTKAEIFELIKLGIRQHGHSGDGRSIDIFVPEGTKVPVDLSDVRAYGGAEGVSGILPGSGHTWVGHLTEDSKSGGHQAVHDQYPDLSFRGDESDSEVMRKLIKARDPDYKFSWDAGSRNMMEGIGSFETYPSYNNPKSRVVNNIASLVQQPNPQAVGGDNIVINSGNAGSLNIRMPGGGAQQDYLSMFQLHKLSGA